MLWNNVNDTFLESRKVKDDENVKLVNLSSCMAAQLPHMLCMISKNNDFGVGGNVKFFYRSEFYTHEHKIHPSEPENYLLTICIYTKSIYGTVFEIWSIYVEKLPFMKIRKNKPKSEISWSQLLNIRNIQNLHLDVCFCGWRMRYN